jgi:tetratricopeptide (TPR) repeat protein
MPGKDAQQGRGGRRRSGDNVATCPPTTRRRLHRAIRPCRRRPCRSKDLPLETSGKKKKRSSRDEHIWSRTYERTSSDVLRLQDDLAAAITKEVTGAAQAQLPAARATTVDPNIDDLYLRGRHAWNQRTPGGFAEAISYFDRAIEKDPTFALAHAGRADAYQLGGQALGKDAATKARAAAQRALDLDSTLAEPHASLAALLHRLDTDIDGAEREFRKAIELNPGYGTAHQWYAILLAEEGRAEEAVREAEEAIKLDPLSAPMRQTLGLVLYYARQYDRAAAAEQRALELAPQLALAREILGRSLLAQKRFDEAVRVYDKRDALTADNLATLALAYHFSGDRERAEATSKRLSDSRPPPIGALLRWHAATGNRAAALAVMERAASTGFNLQQIKADPAFDDMRGDPRFEDLLRRARAQKPRPLPG